MTITITTSNVNGIRAAKRKGIEDWAGKHAPDVWCIQEVRAPQDDVDSIFDEFGFEYATAGKIEAPGQPPCHERGLPGERPRGSRTAHRLGSA